MANEQLIIDTLVQIEQDPAHWNQVWWMRNDPSCGTTYCFAGWVCALSGIKLVKPRRGLNEAYMLHTNGAYEPVSNVALRLLGIDEQNTYYEDSMVWKDHEIFSSSNTLDDIYEHCANELDVDESVLREKVSAQLGRMAD